MKMMELIISTEKQNHITLKVDIILVIYLTHDKTRNKMVAIFHTAFQMHFIEWKCMNVD